MKFSFELPHDLIRALSSAPNTWICLMSFQGKTAVNSSTIWSLKSIIWLQSTAQVIFQPAATKNYHFEAITEKCAWTFWCMLMEWNIVCLTFSAGLFAAQVMGEKRQRVSRGQVQQHHMDQHEFCRADTSGLRPQ